MISILCVDDNPEVVAAIQTKLMRAGGLRWTGSLTSADDLLEFASRECPDVVLLDIDMPGYNPLDALAELVERCPRIRAIVFTGHVRRDLIDRALEVGAWGYVSKNDNEDELLNAVRHVASGEFALSPEARRVYDARS